MAVPLPRPAVIAHRGASAYAPEHTWEAYDLAVELGADALELDVRPMADGTPAVLHDATLARTCGDPRALAKVTAADLEALDPDRRPPTLHAVLDRYASTSTFLVELKAPRPQDLGQILSAVAAAGVRDRVVLQSFDHGALRSLHALDPGLPLCALYPKAIPGRLVQASITRNASWLAAVAPCAGTVDAAFVRRAHALDLRVHPYTVNEDAELARLAALDVDGLITDVPDRARVALTASAALAA